MAYFISHAECTSDHPASGWYFTREGENGRDLLFGPFRTKADALDGESDGAHSGHLADYRRADREDRAIRARLLGLSD